MAQFALYVCEDCGKEIRVSPNGSVLYEGWFGVKEPVEISTANLLRGPQPQKYFCSARCLSDYYSYENN